MPRVEQITPGTDSDANASSEKRCTGYEGMVRC